MTPDPVLRKLTALIEQVRPYVEAEGGSVALDRLEGDTAHIQMRGPHTGCASLLIVQKLAIERRILADIPEVQRVEVSAGVVVTELTPRGDDPETI